MAYNEKNNPFALAPHCPVDFLVVTPNSEHIFIGNSGLKKLFQYTVNSFEGRFEYTDTELKNNHPNGFEKLWATSDNNWLFVADTTGNLSQISLQQQKVHRIFREENIPGGINCITEVASEEEKCLYFSNQKGDVYKWSIENESIIGGMALGISGDMVISMGTDEKKQFLFGKSTQSYMKKWSLLDGEEVCHIDAKYDWCVLFMLTEKSRS